MSPAYHKPQYYHSNPDKKHHEPCGENKRENDARAERDQHKPKRLQAHTFPAFLPFMFLLYSRAFFVFQLKAHKPEIHGLMAEIPRVFLSFPDLPVKT